VSELKIENNFHPRGDTEEAGPIHELEGFPANEGKIGEYKALYGFSIRHSRPKNPIQLRNGPS
jgi:hypothetical protein